MGASSLTRVLAAFAAQDVKTAHDFLHYAGFDDFVLPLDSVVQQAPGYAQLTYNATNFEPVLYVSQLPPAAVDGLFEAMDILHGAGFVLNLDLQPSKEWIMQCMAPECKTPFVFGAVQLMWTEDESIVDTYAAHDDRTFGDVVDGVLE